MKLGLSLAPVIAEIHGLDTPGSDIRTSQGIEKDELAHITE